MPFNIQALTRDTAAVGNDVTKNFTTGVGTPLGGLNMWSYNGITSGDAQAAIAAAGYFNSQTQNFQLGDLIWVYDNAGIGQLYTVSAINYSTNVTTITAFAAFGGLVGTANIAALAITTPLIALGAVGTAQLAANSVTSATV